MTVTKIKGSEASLVTERVRRIKADLRDEPVHVYTERLRFLLDVYKEYEGHPSVTKRARLFEKVLAEMPIFIDENPIVGTMTPFKVGAIPFPQSSCSWMLTSAALRSGVVDKVSTFQEDENTLVKEAVDYWLYRCISSRSHKAYKQLYPELDIVNILKSGIISLVPPAGTVSPAVLNNEKVLQKGLEGIIQEAEEALSRLSKGDILDHDKRLFLNATLICLNAAIKFAHRYAALARDMAEKETDPERKKELEEIAKACERVPAKPARTFREAVQTVWFLHVLSWIEGTQSALSLGRFARYMYPFYEKDKKEGRITEEEAIELIELFFLKLLPLQQFLSGQDFFRKQGGAFQNITLGGLTGDGEDATNEVDFLLLEAQRRITAIQPTLSVLYHDKMSEEFLLKCADVIKESGLGQPSFFNNNLYVTRALLNHPGISVEDARQHCCVLGCNEEVIEGSTHYICTGVFNSAKIVELALNNGKDPQTGAQIGPKTGDPETFKSYKELHEAVKKQVQFFMKLVLELNNIGFNHRAELYQMPFQSALVDGCIENGKDLYGGGARYNTGGSIMVGTIDMADSLAALKKLVFDDKALTMRELLDALKADFAGKEDVQRMLLAAPKFGNDDDYVDQIAREWYHILGEEHQKTPFYLTERTTSRPESYTGGVHFGQGRLTGALPSGRKARAALADASVSPMPGTERNGPTAVIKSAAKAVDTIKYGGTQLNMKFLPAALQSKDGVRKLLLLTKAYMDMGGSHVQFNCVSNETLRDAQAHPEKHRDLVVRVAGFSAYFVLLDKGVQDEVIKRSELSFR